MNITKILYFFTVTRQYQEKIAQKYIETDRSGNQEHTQSIFDERI